MSEVDLVGGEGEFFDFDLKNEPEESVISSVFKQSVPDESTQNDRSFFKTLKYEVSLGYENLTCEAWWNKIEPFNIYLGALPLQNNGHLDELISLGVSKVIALVEDFELEDGWINEPVKPNNFEEKDISVERIHAVDFLPLTRDQIEKAVDLIHQCVLQNEVIYVHCKAGRGRSATAVIAYLIAYQGFSFDESLSLVKEQRPQVNLNSQQQQAIFDYFGIKPST